MEVVNIYTIKKLIVLAKTMHWMCRDRSHYVIVQTTAAALRNIITHFRHSGITSS